MTNMNPKEDLLFNFSYLSFLPKIKEFHLYSQFSTWLY